MDKYFYIAVPSEDFEEVKHTYYEAPSTYLRVYNSNRIDELEAELYAVQQQNKQLVDAVLNADVYLKLDEDIPDDKELAYELGYKDALLNLSDAIRYIQGGSDNG